MRNFADCVYLRKGFADNILAQPTPKFLYPPGNLPREIVETTTLRFRVAQDINYIFELYRHDTYIPEANGLAGSRFGKSSQEGPKPTTSGWAACLYHQEWSNKFGENAAVKVGDPVSWKANLTEFFPPSPDHPDPEFTPGDETFHCFWEIVESLMTELNLKGENVIREETPGQKMNVAGLPGPKPNGLTARPAPITNGVVNTPQTTNGLGLRSAMANGVFGGPPTPMNGIGSSSRPGQVPGTGNH